MKASQFIALNRPHEDNSLVPGVLVISHPEASSNAVRTRFTNDYHAALHAVEEANPEEWNVDEVYAKLKAAGWDFYVVNQPIELHY